MPRIDRIGMAAFLTGALFAAAPALAHGEHGGAAPAAAGEAQCFEAERSYFTDLPLVTQEGRPVRFFSDVLLGRTVLINFIFTQCEDACPLLTAKMVQAAEQFRKTGKGPVSLVSISVDPANDTPEALARFADMHGPAGDWTLLTGAPEDIMRVLARLGQHSTDRNAHTTLLLAGNVNARRWVKIPPMDGPELIAHRLALLSTAQAANAACGS